MNLLDKFRGKGKPAQSAAPKRPQISAQMNLAQRAQLLIAELVRDLDAPNQAIINDLIALITALSQNPDPKLDMTRVMQTAEVLIGQLVRPMSNPNQQLIDELLHLITLSGQPGAHQQQPLTQAAAAVAQQAGPPKNPPAAQSAKPKEQKPAQPVQSTAQPESKKEEKPVAAAAPPVQEKKEEKPKAAQPAPPKEKKEDKKSATQALKEATQAAPKQSGPKVDNHMMSLIIEQTKEVVKVTNTLKKQLADIEERMSGRLSSQEQAINNLQLKTEAHDHSFEDIQKAMDKFIGLYEIITNQFNPFVAEKEEGQQGANQNQGTASAPQQAPAASQPPQAQQPQMQQPPTTAPAPQQTQQPQSTPAPPQPQQTPAARQPAQAPPAAPAPQQAQQTQQPAQSEPVQQNISVETPPAGSDGATENLPTDLGEMVKFLKKASQSEYDTLINGDTNLLARWATSSLQNDTLSQAMLQKPSKQDAVKMLMKEVLKAKVAAQRAKQGA